MTLDINTLTAAMGEKIRVPGAERDFYYKLLNLFGPKSASAKQYCAFDTGDYEKEEERLMKLWNEILFDEEGEPFENDGMMNERMMNRNQTRIIPTKKIVRLVQVQM
ncbi:hypothetical protein QE152_g21741 [Popillia japonica]|uniref:Uncharacterized protein n=1 Tax=Popillia japonica TaxID=7064 RepID=A0AAW1KMJ2_POPJA